MTFDAYLTEHGITQDTAQQFGWVDTGSFKIAIPIKDRQGNLLFHKYRHLNDPNQKFSYDSGSTSCLYNLEVLDKPSKFPFIIICEGEPDCIRLSQDGIPAVCSTSGAGTFKESWAEELKATKKQVIILMDNDPAGLDGALKLSALLPSAWTAQLPDNFKDVCDYLLTHTTSDLIRLLKEVRSANVASFEELCEVVDKWLKLPDKNVLKVIVAGLVAHHFASDPLWIFLVAPPSGTKTELITTISDLPFVYPLSDLTAQTFASGMIAKKDNDPSLLSKLKNNVLVMKDFTTVLNMRREDRAMILSQLREIYDGKYSKAFGTGKQLNWEGRLSMIAGVTSIIDTQLAVFQVMGERFIMYRIPQPNDKEVARLALKMTGHEKQMRQELKSGIKRFFNSITIPNIEDIVMPEEILNSLASLASFVVIARSGVIRDQYRREVEYIPSPEAPSRLAKQLGTLIKALAVIEKRKVVTWDDYLLTLRIALDVIPRNRSLHLVALGTSEYMVSTTDISLFTSYSRGGTEMILEDLTALELVTVSRSGGGSANRWELSDKAKDYFKDIIPQEASEFVPKFFPETDFYYPLINRMLHTEGEEEIASAFADI